MSTGNMYALAHRQAGWAARFSYPDASAHARLLMFLLANTAFLTLAFYLEDQILPWRQRMVQQTPGWAWVLAQATTVGLAMAIGVRGGWLSVSQGLLAATLLGYAYVAGGLWLIDPRRTFQIAVLIWRAVHVGLVVAIVMTAGVALRLVLRQRLACSHEPPSTQTRHHSLQELMFLVAACAVGLRVAMEFAFDVERNRQMQEIGMSLLRAVPVTVPWLYLLTQSRLNRPALATACALSLAFAGIEFVMGTVQAEEKWDAVLVHVGQFDFALAAGAILNGVLLRWFGFRWQRG